MIKHVVLFKFYNEVTFEERAAAIELLRGMPLKTANVKFLDWEVAEDLNKESDNWDLAEIAVFENKGQLDAFKNHAAHEEAARVFREIADWRAVDFEIQDENEAV